MNLLLMNKTRFFEILTWLTAKSKPWIFYVLLFLVLRYTGMLSYVTGFTQQALLKTGIMNANPATDADVKKNFDYEFQLMDHNQQLVDISSLKGKTIFINVWATWCGPCRAEMPSIQNLYEAVKSDEIVFIMLALDKKEPLVKVPEYINSYSYTFPVYYPVSGSRLPPLLQVNSIPSTFVISPEGKVVFEETGASNYDTEDFQKFMKGL